MKTPRIINLSRELSFRPMTPQGQIVGIVGHYSAGSRDTSTADALAKWKGIHNQHLDQGWSGIGYQIGFTIDGDIALLRPFTVLGAHVSGANTGRIGVSVHGTTGDEWSKAQHRAYRWWCKHGHESKHFPSSHRTPRPPRDLRIWVHRDLGATACPGQYEAGYRNPRKRQP